MSPRRFTPEQLRRFETAEEIEIETRSGRTTIWVVVSEGEAYVRSVRGTAGRWYRELRKAKQGTVHIGRTAIPVRAFAVRSPDTIRRVSAAYRRKYADSPALGSMLAKHTLPTTLRLAPR